MQRGSQAEKWFAQKVSIEIIIILKKSGNNLEETFWELKVKVSPPPTPTLIIRDTYATLCNYHHIIFGCCVEAGDTRTKDSRVVNVFLFRPLDLQTHILERHFSLKSRPL